MDNGRTPQARQPTLASGKATLSTTALAIGTHSITAVYAGNTSFYASTSAALAQKVTSASALTKLTAPTALLHTASTVLSGTITPGATGNLTITVNGVARTARINSHQRFSATLNSSALAVGSYTITYAYAGNGTYLATTSTAALVIAYTATATFGAGTAQHAGAKVAITVKLSDAAKTAIGSTSIPVTYAGYALASTPNTLIAPTGATAFTFQSNVSYLFNFTLPTGIAVGTYLFYYKAGNDPTPHSVQFAVNEGGIRTKKSRPRHSGKGSGAGGQRTDGYTHQECDGVSI